MLIHGRIAAIVAAVLVTATAGRVHAEVKTQWIDYQQGGTALQGYLVYDDSATGPRPGVLLVHRRDGMSELTLRNSEMIARLGYVVFAPDIFGKDKRPKDVAEEKALSAALNEDRPLMRARAQAGMEILRKTPLVDPSRIAVLGYCFGGTVGVELAETGVPIVGLVAIHGSFRGFAPGLAKNIKGRVLILHGAEDTVAPLSSVQALIAEFRSAKVGWELNLYSGTGHGFSTPKNPAEERANRESQIATARFFKEVFGQ